MSHPFITKRIADSYMIQHGGSQQAGQKNAGWLTLPLPTRPNSQGIWHPSIFEAARFEELELAELVLSFLSDQS